MLYKLSYFNEPFFDSALAILFSLLTLALSHLLSNFDADQRQSERVSEGVNEWEVKIKQKKICRKELLKANK